MRFSRADKTTCCCVLGILVLMLCPRGAHAQQGTFRPWTPLLTEVDLNGKSYKFAIATGCPITVFDSSLRPILPPVVHSSESPDVSIHEGAVYMVVAGKKVAIERSASADLMGKYYQERGSKVHGAIGFDVLKGFVLDVQFDRRRTTLSRDSQQRISPGVELPLEFGPHGMPRLSGWLDGQKRQFAIETGAIQTISIPKADCERPMKARRWLITGYGHMTGPAHSTPARKISFRGPRFRIGPFEHERLVFDLDESSDVAMLGLEYLRRYGRIVLDFPNKRVFLEKGSRFHAPSFADKCGLNLSGRNNRLFAVNVVQGSPAWQAGIRRGSEITRVAHLKSPSVRDADHFLMCEGARVIEVEYIKDGMRHVVDLERSKSDRIGTIQRP